ncbi:ATP-dependent DNA helicase RecG [Clostridium sp. DSM 8431]|uniref:ATP-dependent DNA helicase RecG n=1 Tax=Clostridium sp. DSM 8431 TaxID=1761781 RepID=UPI0008DF6F73|nr:ATP-dependent DNA helicase RecG [Clostridium sp. DSM 8431]SFU36962.1 ATP-dependent DNA helicase RecG [Clostridium sp. DSM 8431]
MDIYSSVSSLKGVGPKASEKLNKAGIFNILDLLLYFPRDYEFLSGNPEFNEIDCEEKQILTCTVKKIGSAIRTRNGKYLVTIEFEYKGHKVEGKWFNQPYIRNNFRLGCDYSLLGKFKRIGNMLEIVNPIIGGNVVLNSEIKPIYPLKGDLTDKFLTKQIISVLENIKISENLPKEILERYKLISLDSAIREIHFPKDKELLNSAITRLKFQELFTYSMKLLLLKHNIKGKSKGISFPWNDKLSELKKALPYELTGAQTRVVRDILRDQKSPLPMNRLVQGDVGSGKTVVALIAIYNVYTNGYKSAFMVPTEILANQHYEEAKKLLSPFGVEIELLTGSTSAKEKKRIKERIKEDGPLVVIGTHALIQEDVEFNKLGLVITDEQHRFGVEQRSKLINKGLRADCLVMTATPIPRTLALYLYSDLDVSAIDELPPGRKKIDTRFFQESASDKAYKLVMDEIDKGRQAYIVCPLIEEDEKEQLNSVESVYRKLKDGIFRDIEVEILHGKMKPQEKDEIITRFKENKTKVLISTTVIEVGVNVPNASVMIVENAERFGLAQLHQLRGRVGRGEYESYCILIANAKTNTTKKRMMIMTESTDGFYISEQDLKLRGSGEMFGMKQSGTEGLLLADIYEDMNILRCARGEANKILGNINEENKRMVYEISMGLEKSSKYICFN